MNRIVLGITGRKYSGKDSLAIALGNVVGPRVSVTPLALAEPLKEGLRVAFGLTQQQLYGNQKEVPDRRFRTDERPEGITPRELMQGFGEWGRKQYLDVWVMRLRERMEEIEQNLPAPPNGEPYVVLYIITDVRHFNEAEAVQRILKGRMVRIVRPNSSTGQFEDHESEKWVEALPVDYLVQNDGTLEDLDRRALNLYVSILGSHK